MSHSDPVTLRNPDRSLKTVPGNLVLWRWLSLDRFFPPDRNTWPEIMRGCASVSVDMSSTIVL